MLNYNEESEGTSIRFQARRQSPVLILLLYSTYCSQTLK